MARISASAGAAAIEFALVFPLLFLLVYGVIVYAYVFVVHESINFAAQEAAEAAVAVDPRGLDPGAYTTAVERRVRATAVAVLDWMPADQRNRVLGAGGERVEVAFRNVDGSQTVVVTLRFDLQEPRPVFPVLVLPLVGEIPPLPEQLLVRAVARI